MPEGPQEARSRGSRAAVSAPSVLVPGPESKASLQAQPHQRLDFMLSSSKDHDEPTSPPPRPGLLNARLTHAQVNVLK